MRSRLLAEGLGTGLLLYLIVGSGIAAEVLSRDAGTQLFTHAVVVGLGLSALIAMFQTISGSHFNPAVTLAFWRTGDVPSGEALRYFAAQLSGAVLGVITANVTFGAEAMSVSETVRSGAGLVTAEAIGTFVLVLSILLLVRTSRASLVPAVVGAWVAAIVFATASTGFANPAVTVARVFTDTYTGIAPASVFAFVAAQLLAGILAALTVPALLPRPVPVETTK
jgi:glycerol uptake facilitator-like aquaporin